MTKTAQHLKLTITAALALTAALCATLLSAPQQALAYKDADGLEVQEMQRLYNPYSGEHFYTADTSEKDGLVKVGWEYEGVGWIAPSASPESSQPRVYRLYNPYAGEHHYTQQVSERDALTAVGWVDEGIGWYTCVTLRVPVYREYNPNEFCNNHNYTTDKSEHENLVALGWVDEGIAWFGTDTRERLDQAAAEFEATHVHNWTPETNTYTSRGQEHPVDVVGYETSDLKWFEKKEDALAHAEEVGPFWEGELYRERIGAVMVKDPDEEVTDILGYWCHDCGTYLSVDQFQERYGYLPE